MPRPLRSFRTPALIIKRRDMGEADRLLTLFTPEHGKIEAIAKGARKPTSTKTGHVELFTRSEMLIAKGRTFDIITQAEMNQPYLALREDLLRGAYASYCAELLDRFAFEDDTYTVSLFTLLDDTFARLCDDSDLRRVVRYFEVQLLDKVGYKPELQECVITHDPIMPEDQFFSHIEGGVVSQEGAPHTSSLVPLPVNTLKTMRHLQRSTYKQIASLKIPLLLHNDLERVILGYIRYILEIKLQSVDFIRLLQR